MAFNLSILESLRHPNATISHIPFKKFCEDGFLEGIKFLVESGTINANRSFDRPLNYEIQAGNLDIVKFLVEKGAEVNRNRCDDMSPLHCAIKYFRVDIFKYLIDNGATVDRHIDSLINSILEGYYSMFAVGVFAEYGVPNEIYYDFEDYSEEENRFIIDFPEFQEFKEYLLTIRIPPDTESDDEPDINSNHILYDFEDVHITNTNELVIAPCSVTDDWSCVICCDSSIEEDEAVKTNCNHIFHKKCITTWFAVKSTCPFCRTEL